MPVCDLATGTSRAVESMEQATVGMIACGIGYVTVAGGDTGSQPLIEHGILPRAGALVAGFPAQLAIVHFPGAQQQGLPVSCVSPCASCTDGALGTARGARATAAGA